MDSGYRFTCDHDPNTRWIGYWHPADDAQTIIVRCLCGKYQQRTELSYRDESSEDSIQGWIYEAQGALRAQRDAAGDGAKAYGEWAHLDEGR